MTLKLKTAAVPGAILLSMAFLAPSAQAQTSEVFLQNATTYSVGDTIFVYSLPVKRSSDAKVGYWDLQLSLQADDASGKPNKATFANVVKSPSIKKSEFVTGSYLKGMCVLKASPFSGRTEYELTCNDNGSIGIFVFYTGGIAGHPYEADLKAAKLDTIVGSAEYSWGKKAFGGTWFNCFDNSELLSARQSGDTLTLINWGGNVVEDCRFNLVRQP